MLRASSTGASALEKKLPAAIYLKAEYLQRRGSRWIRLRHAQRYIKRRLRSRKHPRRPLQRVPDHPSPQLPRSLHADGLPTRAPARDPIRLSISTSTVPILSAAAPGPYPWDTPNRFLSWGYLASLQAPDHSSTRSRLHGRGPHRISFQPAQQQQQLIGMPGAERFPDYLALNLQLEKRFHLFGYYLAVRGGFDNVRGAAIPSSSTTSSIP